MMLSGAFAAFLAAGLFQQSFGGAAGDGLFDATPALMVGVLAAIATSMALSLLHAWLSISISADQIISGTIINIAAIGMTGYLNRLLISPNPRLGAGTFSSFDLPKEIEDLPVIGWIIEMFINQGPIAMSVIVLVIVLQVLLFRSRWGLRTRSVGEHPRAADTVGINVIGLRYRNVILGGVFAGLAGAYLTLEGTGSFQNGMTAGRGFIALAAVIFGRWTPLGAWGAALLFAFSGAFGQAVRIRPPGADYPGLDTIMAAIPSQVYGALPYIVTIVILAGVVGRSVAPAAVGKPYQKEGRTA
jgi:general nucleoside transport system permease protein